MLRSRTNRSYLGMPDPIIRLLDLLICDHRVYVRNNCVYQSESLIDGSTIFGIFVTDYCTLVISFDQAVFLRCFEDFELKSNLLPMFLVEPIIWI